MYCDSHGKQHAYSAVCPHMGCIIHVRPLRFRPGLAGAGGGGDPGRGQAAHPASLPRPSQRTEPFSHTLLTPFRSTGQWNSIEKTFDCPCHGSNFSCDGRVIQGPAKGDLKPIEDW